MSFFLLSLSGSFRGQGEFKVTERRMDMKELLGALDAGRVLEVFGAGTACVVCPVGSLLYKDKVGRRSPFTWSPRFWGSLTLLCVT